MVKKNRLNNKWDALSLRDKAELMKIYLEEGITDIHEMKNDYNSNSYIFDRVDATNKSDGVRRLKDPKREVLHNPDGTVSTHEYAYSTNKDNTEAIVYPTVQSTEKGLRRMQDIDAYYRALETGDTIKMTPREAEFFTTKYKSHYPTFHKYNDGGELDGDELNQQPKSWLDRVREGAARAKSIISNGNVFGTSKPVKNETKPLEERLQENGRVRKHALAKYTDIVHPAGEDLRREQIAKVKAARKIGRSSDNYYIPYDTIHEYAIDGNFRVSKSVLDSIALAAYNTGTPLSDALGLAYYETKMGGIPNRSGSKGLDFNFSELIGESSLPESSINRLKSRAVMNMNFAREFGGIEPSYLMNDHTWARGISGVKEIDTVKHPLQHALLMFKHNKYNPLSSSHSSSVKSEGKRLMTLPVIQEWLAGSEFGRNALRGKNK